MMTQRALLVLTSHTELGHTGRGTGFYYDEMAAPPHLKNCFDNAKRIIVIAAKCTGQALNTDPMQ